LRGNIPTRIGISRSDCRFSGDLELYGKIARLEKSISQKQERSLHAEIKRERHQQAADGKETEPCEATDSGDSGEGHIIDVCDLFVSEIEAVGESGYHACSRDAKPAQDTVVADGRGHQQSQCKRQDWEPKDIAKGVQLTRNHAFLVRQAYSRWSLVCDFNCPS